MSTIALLYVSHAGAFTLGLILAAILSVGGKS
jgi:hypothetical protein